MLSQRRIQKNQEFSIYLELFLKEIENGAISKRVPKIKKNQFLLRQSPE